MDRSFALGRLCKRLGEFEESLCLSVVPPPEPEPVSHVCAKEWHEYQAQRRQLAEERHLEHERCTENRQREKEAQQQERQAVLARMAPHGLPLLNIARHFLLLQQQSQKTEKKKKQAKVRHSLPRFKHWLAQKNHRLGQLWRLRNRITPDMQIKEFRFHQQCRLKSPLYAFQATLAYKSHAHFGQSCVQLMPACGTQDDGMALFLRHALGRGPGATKCRTGGPGAV